MKNYAHPIISEQAISNVTSLLRTGLLSGYTGTPAGHLGGKHVQALEEAFREYFGVKYAVAMNSATACLHAAVIACETRQAVVTPFTFSASAACVKMDKGYLTWTDVEEDYFCMDTASRNIWWQEADTIIPVHLCGQPADMHQIMKVAERFHLKVIEDAAQSIGAKYNGQFAGTIGDCGIFSFNQSKQISTGEGGILITNDDKIARITRAVRNHGEVSDPELKMVGWNYRMTEVEAILALDQFKQLDNNIRIRQELAQYMDEQIEKNFDFIIPPKVREGCTHTYYTYAARYLRDDRDIFQQKLIDNGVFFGKNGYVKPLYHLPAYGGIQEEICPVAERMHKKEIMVTDRLRFPATFNDVDEMIEVMKKCQ